MRETRLSDIHTVLAEAMVLFERYPFETPTDYENLVSVTLWKLGYPNSLDTLGPDDAEIFLMEYFEDFQGSRPTPYKKWQVNLH